METIANYFVPNLGWPDDEPEELPLDENELSEEEFLSVLFYVEPVAEMAAA